VSHSAVVADLSWHVWLSIGLSIAAFVFALVSTVLALRADRRSGRNERREEERLERERLEAEAADRARLQLWPEGSSTTIDHRRFGFTMRNHGKATAHKICVWLADKDGQDVSVTPQPTFTLAPDEAADNHGVPVPLDLDPLDLRFVYCWFDGGGYHARPTHIPPMP
jgi:heme exporter protein D